METPNVVHKFIENSCEIKIPITKRIEHYKNCDLFIFESVFCFVADIEVTTFKCSRQFDATAMKDIPISFDSEKYEFTCTLPCCPVSNDEASMETEVPTESPTEVPTEVSTEDPTEGPTEEPKRKEAAVDSSMFIRITDSCILSVDGSVSKIETNFPYGFAAHYRGKLKFDEADVEQICRITDPSSISHVQRVIQRENDEVKDFCPDQYKLNCYHLDIPEGHENPMFYKIPFDDVVLSQEDSSVLEDIRTKFAKFEFDTDQTYNIDCDLVSVLLGICFDIRFTENEPTCVSAWTRTILSPSLSYFERYEDLAYVVETFLRRTLIYPLYRNYELSCLCVQDVVEALKKGKEWIMKQLLVTYKCFSESEPNRKVLNKYFMRHLIWYVDGVIDEEHLESLSMHLKAVLLCVSKNDLRLGLDRIEIEMLRELIAEYQSEVSNGLEQSSSSSEEDSDSTSSSESD